MRVNIDNKDRERGWNNLPKAWCPHGINLVREAGRSRAVGEPEIPRAVRQALENWSAARPDGPEDEEVHGQEGAEDADEVVRWAAAAVPYRRKAHRGTVTQQERMRQSAFGVDGFDQRLQVRVRLLRRFRTAFSQLCASVAGHFAEPPCSAVSLVTVTICMSCHPTV